ncbi:MBL fold metallo-hydrolase [Amphritea pacifica]|uniref:MBL fold metallo-hydrolase n=1 Tax=Amphritea pacifica TaxID=2811233 RepID=A0ABS2WAX0_9GAMM|nr:MBL fold metallo-hydrolase [Amphritea pacifica]MBN0988632.1 MBL fold metallo-hydrolase [Amphritea pacifica]MBN1005378.1 MBL fold metallo-hydrolase [Amphritea pacifica]
MSFESTIQNDSVAIRGQGASTGKESPERYKPVSGRKDQYIDCIGKSEAAAVRFKHANLNGQWIALAFDSILILEGVIVNSIVTAKYAVPEPGQLLEVAPGVLWLRMPLPFELDHINLYLIDDTDGWVVVDCGLGNSDTRAVWQNVIASYLQGRPIKKVILTHAHIDHIGAAGWLCQYTGAPLWITAGEQATAEEYFQLEGECGDTIKDQARCFLHSLGMDQQQVTGIMGIFSGISSLVHPLPDTIRELKEGMGIQIGTAEWRVIVSEGHSEAHACLYSEALGVLISGDQVLPRISSNVSVRAGKPDANPMRAWIGSLERLQALPADTLILPAHERPFYGLRQRLDELIEEHMETLLNVERACSEPVTVMQLAGLIYQRKLTLFDLLLAGGECLANLNYLLAEKRLQCLPDADSVLVFSQLQSQQRQSDD